LFMIRLKLSLSDKYVQNGQAVQVAELVQNVQAVQIGGTVPEVPRFQKFQMFNRNVEQGRRVEIAGTVGTSSASCTFAQLRNYR